MFVANYTQSVKVELLTYGEAQEVTKGDTMFVAHRLVQELVHNNKGYEANNVMGFFIEAEVPSFVSDETKVERIFADFKFCADKNIYFIKTIASVKLVAYLAHLKEVNEKFFNDEYDRWREDTAFHMSLSNAESTLIDDQIHLVVEMAENRVCECKVRSRAVDRFKVVAELLMENKKAEAKIADDAIYFSLIKSILKRVSENI